MLDGMDSNGNRNGIFLLCTFNVRACKLFGLKGPLSRSHNIPCVLGYMRKSSYNLRHWYLCESHCDGTIPSGDPHITHDSDSCANQSVIPQYHVVVLIKPMILLVVLIEELGISQYQALLHNTFYSNFLLSLIEKFTKV